MTRNSLKFLAAFAVVVVVVVVATVLGGRRAAADAEQFFKDAKAEVAKERPEKKPVLKLKASKSANDAKYIFATASAPDSQTVIDALLNDLDTQDEDKIAAALKKSYDLSVADQAKFSLAALERIADPNYRRDIVNNTRGTASRQFLPMLAKAASDSDPGVRAEAIIALAGFDEHRTRAAEDWDRGLTAEEAAAEDKQLEKLDRLNEVFDTQDTNTVNKILKEALNDEDEDVRKEALSTLKVLEPELQLAALEAAVSSSYENVVLDALTYISVTFNKDTLLLTLEALNHPSQQVFEQAQDVINIMVDQKFETRDAAIKWWKENADRYNYDLTEKDSGPDATPDAPAWK